MQERRSEVRMMCADLIEVRWKDATGHPKHATALLEDISRSGVCLQFETSIPLGTHVQWDSPKCRFSGEVRYCVYREIGYFVGVELDSASKWSKRSFRPQHLLDLKRLIPKASK